MAPIPSDLDDLTVKVSELLIATADHYDRALDRVICDVLGEIRRKLGMDVVFVSEFVDGQRIFRFVDRAANAPELPVGGGDSLEESYCQRVVDGRLPELVHDVATSPQAKGLPAAPFRVGAHLSTPIVMTDGHAYGTLCCFSTAPNTQLQRRDLETLRMCAQLVARKINATKNKDEALNWNLMPMGEEQRAESQP